MEIMTHTESNYARAPSRQLPLFFSVKIGLPGEFVENVCCDK